MWLFGVAVNFISSLEFYNFVQGLQAMIPVLGAGNLVIFAFLLGRTHETFFNQDHTLLAPLHHPKPEEPNNF